MLRIGDGGVQGIHALREMDVEGCSPDRSRSAMSAFSHEEEGRASFCWRSAVQLTAVRMARFERGHRVITVRR
jgi:hypothetical protein